MTLTDAKSSIFSKYAMREKVKLLLARSARVYNLVRKYYGFKRPAKSILQNRRYGLNYLKCYTSAILRKQKSLGRPILLTIEPINICDQRCTICETGLGILGRKPKAMSFEEFKYILDQFDDYLRTIYFYFMGESFLNRDAYRMIRYAADMGIYVSACTNGNRVNPEELVRSGIADIQFQIAGTTQDVHATYRVGVDLTRVIHNIKKTLEWRKQLSNEISKNPYPMKVGMGYILLKPNEHQVKDFFQLAKELTVDEYQIVDPCVRTVEHGKELLPTDRSHWIYDPEAFKNGKLRPRVRPNNYCEWIYGTVTIQVNGDVVPCCRDPKGKWVLGNVFDENIYDIWNGKQFRKLRKAVTTRQKELPLCALCEGYGMPDVLCMSEIK